MKNLNFRTTIVVVLIIFMSFGAYSQTTGDISGNNYFVASSMKEGGKNVIFIYKFTTKEFVRKLNFEISNNKYIYEIKFSYSGKFLYVRQNKDFYVFDVINNNEITKIYNAKQVIFAKNDDIYIALKDNKVTSYDCYTGNSKVAYKNPSDREIYRIDISPDDNFVVGITKDRINVWNTNQSKYKKELIGSDIKFRDNMQYATVISREIEKVRILTYKIPTFYMEKALSSEVLFKNESIGGFGKYKHIPQRASISKSGQYVALYTAKDNAVDIYIYNTISGNKMWVINNNKNPENELYPQRWITDKRFIAYGADMQAGDYNVVAHTAKSLSLAFSKTDAETELTIDKQKKERIISDNHKFVVMQTYKAGKPVMYLKSSSIPNKKLTLKDVEFVAFSANNNYIFVKKDGVVSVIVANDVENGILNSKPVDLYTMDKTLKPVPTEQLVGSDTKPPKGYAYYYVNNTKQIALVDTTKLELAFRSVKANGNDVEIKVNLVDKNGNAFTGAIDPNWQFVWCNLLLQKPDNSVVQVHDFVVEEVNETEPAAIALVLDHSGSMGAKRANNLQFGASNLVNERKNKDAFLLIKYDHRVKIDVALTKDTYNVTKKLSGTGLNGYGGGTALIDATYLAILRLKKQTEYKKKIVILFTDGYENASFYNKYDVIKEAVENNVEIHVIGFGNLINEQYLKSIAYSTGGTYNRLYASNNLKKIFTDVDLKRRHYYSVKFKANLKGKYIAMLQLCQDESQHDSIIVPFDNNTDKKRYDQRAPVPKLDLRAIKLAQFQKLSISRKMKLAPVISKKIQSDFEKINFPDIFFSPGKSTILKSDEKGLLEIAEFMKKYPYVYLEINGHTDNVGDPETNLNLSKERAKAAKKLLESKGIARGRLKAKGFGQTKPISANDTEEGRKQNRRIEFLIYQQRR